jgi:F-type H+-transporting ATPase subunit delta
MIAGSIGRRYAKALLDIAKDQGKPEEYLKELEAFQAALVSSTDLRFLLIDPAFEPGQRKKILARLAGPIHLSPMTHNFLNLLIDHERISFFQDILHSYREMVDEALNRVRVKVTVANGLPKDAEDTLKNMLERITHRQVLLEIDSDPELLGGMVIKIKDEVFDGSIKEMLHQLKERMMQAPMG